VILARTLPTLRKQPLGEHAPPPPTPTPAASSTWVARPPIAQTSCIAACARIIGHAKTSRKQLTPAIKTEVKVESKCHISYSPGLSPAIRPPQRGSTQPPSVTLHIAGDVPYRSVPYRCIPSTFLFTSCFPHYRYASLPLPPGYLPITSSLNANRSLNRQLHPIRTATILLRSALAPPSEHSRSPSCSTAPRRPLLGPSQTTCGRPKASQCRKSPMRASRSGSSAS
jgi:hypothetical protein